jgi:hypothetical protein
MEHIFTLSRWLDYVFGICKPDQRIGKRGSRCVCPYSKFHSKLSILILRRI